MTVSDRRRAGRAVVVGAGHVGMIAAMRLAEANVFAEVVLVDVAGSRAEGIALDLTHTGALTGSGTAVRGVTTLADAGPADYVVVTAGKARTPGMSRTDLVSTNAAIVGSASDIAAHSPDAMVVVVSNPLDEMTYQLWRVSGFPAHRVVGMAGLLDSARFRALASVGGAGDVTGLDALALGSHGAEMVIPLSHAPQVMSALPSEDVAAIEDRARNSGGEVVGLLGDGSAFFGPGTAAARMVLAMVADSDEVISATVRPDGEYGLRDVYVGLPAVLGATGSARSSRSTSHPTNSGNCVTPPPASASGSRSCPETRSGQGVRAGRPPVARPRRGGR
ncbi:lactate dehydrogenase [Rhodococcus sp. NPDC003318]|uniref:lactate/malate family dehydrogenase n=1 Tax=Rhodococcus sp. NPDC003318 TaxID=3364503 RepID=UPI00369B2255